VKKTNKKRTAAPLRDYPRTATEAWAPIKHRVNQADVDRAAERTDVEKAATNIANLQSRLTELRNEQRNLECRLQSVRSDMATTMLSHAEAVARFKDKTAITCEVP
jgi:predicted RNase H-like nuclease (RuvC/YqgF family)